MDWNNGLEPATSHGPADAEELRPGWRQCFEEPSEATDRERTVPWMWIKMVHTTFFIRTVRRDHVTRIHHTVPKGKSVPTGRSNPFQITPSFTTHRMERRRFLIPTLGKVPMPFFSSLATIVKRIETFPPLHFRLHSPLWTGPS